MFRICRLFITLATSLVRLLGTLWPAAMVNAARAKNMWVATRDTCMEALDVDRELLELGTDLWAVDARQELEARFAALEEAELALHRTVTSMQDTLNEAAAFPSRGPSAAGPSQPPAGAEPSAAGPSLSRQGSLGRLIAESGRPRTPSPRLPVPVHDLPPPPLRMTPVSPADPLPCHAGTAAPVPDVSMQPRPLRPTPMTGPVPPSVKSSLPLFTPVTLPQGPPQKARPPLSGSVAQCARPPADGGSQPAKPPPPVLNTSSARLSVSMTQAPTLVRATPLPSVFILPGLDLTRIVQPGTPPTAPRRPPAAYGTRSDTAPVRDGTPFYFEQPHPAGWKLVIGDLPVDADPEMVTLMTM